MARLSRTQARKSLSHGESRFNFELETLDRPVDTSEGVRVVALLDMLRFPAARRPFTDSSFVHIILLQISRRHLHGSLVSDGFPKGSNLVWTYLRNADWAGGQLAGVDKDGEGWYIEA